MKPTFSVNDDYATLHTVNGNFYYGYEESKCMSCGDMIPPGEECIHCVDKEQEWCFKAMIKGMEDIVVPHSKLCVQDPFDCTECLMVGIGWVLTKYKLCEG